MFPLSMTELEGGRGGGVPFLIQSDSETTARQCVRPGLAPGPHPTPGDSVRRRDTSKQPLHPGLCHAVESPLSGSPTSLPKECVSLQVLGETHTAQGSPGAQE